MIFLFYLLYFFIVNVFPANAYIDPGTGSMLFAVLTGIISTLFFAGRTVFIKLKTFSFRYKKYGRVEAKQVKNYVFYSEGRQYWNVFKPVIDEFHKRNIKCFYCTSDVEDPGLDYESEYVKAEFIGKGNRAYSKLNILEADVCIMTTPGLDVYQLERSKGVRHYCHILHAVDDVTLYKLFSFDYFDSLFLTGEYQKNSVRELERKRGTKEKELYVTGCTYLDVLSEKINRIEGNKDNDRITVLISPSWGDNALLKRFGMKLILPIAESDFNVIIRPHPQSSISEKGIVDNIMSQLSGFDNVEWDFSRENITSMARSDIMISDFSGIISDYLFLFEKPVIYAKYEFDKRAYDLSDSDSEPWKFKMLKDIGIELSEENFSAIHEIINKNIRNSMLKEKVEKARNTAYMYRGLAGKRCADTLIEIQARLASQTDSKQQKVAME